MHARLASCTVVGLVGLALWSTPSASAAVITAASCSRADVDSAIAASSNGDTVLIPGGTCSWTSGISTTKQISLRAQSYTPTPGGATSRSVTLVNNSSTPLFSLTSGDSHHVALAGIRFNEGTVASNHVRLNGSGAKVPLISDCYFEIANRFGDNPGIAAIAFLAQGGVMWNTRVVGVGGGLGGQCCPEGGSILINSPRAWTTASTMGSRDVNGNVNVYIEDSTLENIGQAPDVDDRGRVVIRHSLLDGVSGLTHGFTSSFGGRHVEYYGNTFSVTHSNRNIAGRYFWMRAGTGVFTNNVVNDAANPGYWGTPTLLSIGDNTSPGTYPMARQPGFGHDGANHVSDPIYVWSNTGARASSYGFQNGWESIVHLNRNLFVDSGPKPGYAPYVYPHPARGPGGTVSPPAAPTHLRAAL